MAKKLADGFGLRRHDHRMVEQGRRLDFRIHEPAHAECYFCDGVGLKDSQEHVIPKWMQSRLDMQNEVFTPTYFSNISDPPHERPPTEAHSLVATGICTGCNNGWMANLEGAFASMFSRSQRRWDVATTVRWFVKTGIVINVGQNSRLLVPRDVRLALAGGELDPRLSLTFHRVARPEPKGGRVNWAQAALLPGMSVPASMTDSCTEFIRQTWACAIRINYLVGTVIYTPAPAVLRSSWERLGYTALSRGLVAQQVPWSKVPALSHFSHGTALVPDETGPWGAFELLEQDFPGEVRGIQELRFYMAVQAGAMAGAVSSETLNVYP